MVDGQYKIGAIIQARLGSTRLPNKVLMPLPLGGDQTIISQVITSLKNVHEVSNIVVASSTSVVNDKLEEYVKSFNIDCYRGDENDVLSRFYEIVKKYKFDYVIRFTADNPVVDELLLKEFIKNFITRKLDYSYSNNLPLGSNFEMMKANQILEAFESTKKLYDKEHVTPYIKRNAINTQVYKFKNITFNSKLRLTIDYPSDYALMGLIFSMLQDKSKSLQNITNLVEDNSWVLKINQNNFQKQNYKSIKEEIAIILPYVRERELARLEKLLLHV